MTIGAIAALVCILLGFIGELVDERLLLETLEWFVAAIGFALLGGPAITWPRRPA